jgi:large subunit ribosomal protein L29
MPNRPAEEARALDETQLAKAIDDAYRELFNLRFRHANRNLDDPNQLRSVRHKIARLRTLQRERQIAAVSEEQ